jgi:hypothetical protein
MGKQKNYNIRIAVQPNVAATLKIFAQTSPHQFRQSFMGSEHFLEKKPNHNYSNYIHSWSISQWQALSTAGSVNHSAPQMHRGTIAAVI